MTLEEIRKWKEFENAVDNEHCKEIADQLDKARTVYYYTSNGMKTTEETNVLDLGEWIDGICYFDGCIEIEVHYNGRPYSVDIPVRIGLENWNEEYQYFENGSVSIKDIEEW